MNKKTLLIALLLSLLMSVSVFAKGESETRSMNDVWETVTVTGTVSFEDYPHPELTSGRTVYELLVPPYSLHTIEVESGDTITIEGVRTENHFESDETYLQVVKATIDGEEYEVSGPEDFGAHRGMRPGGMPMQGWEGPRRFDDSGSPGSMRGGKGMPRR